MLKQAQADFAASLLAEATDLLASEKTSQAASKSRCAQRAGALKEHSAALVQELVRFFWWQERTPCCTLVNVEMMVSLRSDTDGWRADGGSAGEDRRKVRQQTRVPVGRMFGRAAHGRAFGRAFGRSEGRTRTNSRTVCRSYRHARRLDGRVDCRCVGRTGGMDSRPPVARSYGRPDSLIYGKRTAAVSVV